MSQASISFSGKLSQACAVEISPSFTWLFGMSLELGIFPAGRKDVNLVPIHKSDSKSKVLNYRST